MFMGSGVETLRRWEVRMLKQALCLFIIGRGKTKFGAET